MKKIEVVAGIILKENKVLATQRGYGDFKGSWEFPGGKIEDGETHINALVREIKEELNIEVSDEGFVKTVEYDYPNFHLTMHCYMAKILRGNIELLEHNAYKWVNNIDIDSLNWLPADLCVLQEVKNLLLN